MRARWTTWLPVAIAVVVGSFLLATAVGQARMRAVDRVVVELGTTTAPSIEHLAVARGENRNVQVLLRQRVALEARGADDREALDRSMAAVDEEIHEYLVLPVAPGEQELWRDLLGAQEALKAVVGRIEIGVDRGDAEAARAILAAEAEPASASLDRAISQAITFNATRAQTLSREVEQLRGAALYATATLDLVCTAIAIAAAVLLRKMARAHEVLTDSHRALQEARTSELDQFAGRVAHDVLSPLNTVALALDVAAKSDDGAERDRVARRGRAALDRVKRLVGGLLDFARAGAAPTAGARADIGEVLADLEAELAPTAAERGVSLTLEEDGHHIVACDPGVLTSLVANLARNALKYVGDAQDRRVVVRTRDHGRTVRIEVEDDGPGLPPDVARHVFEPYVRARSSSSAPGIGLGLATVKRLVEAHGGRAGVESSLGSGCTFWFELPKAVAD
jgi:signal transduction histidine kinase